MEVREVKYTAPSKSSRYKGYKGYMNETNVYLENPKYIDIPLHGDDNYFSVFGKYINRLDLIANKFYNESKLWWVIAEANNIENPLEVKNGSILRIPALATLYGPGGVIGNG